MDHGTTKTLPIVYVRASANLWTRQRVLIRATTDTCETQLLNARTEGYSASSGLRQTSPRFFLAFSDGASFAAILSSSNFIFLFSERHSSSWHPSFLQPPPLPVSRDMQHGIITTSWKMASGTGRANGFRLKVRK